MGLSKAHCNALLRHYFHNERIENFGDLAGLRGSPIAGSLFVSLHTAAPAGGQSSNEAAYTGYARVPIARNDVAWDLTDVPDVSDHVFVVNGADVVFPEVTALPGVYTHASIGVIVSGATLRLFSSALLVPISPLVGETPTIPAGDLEVFLTVDDA